MNTEEEKYRTLHHCIGRSLSSGGLTIISKPFEVILSPTSLEQGLKTCSNHGSSSFTFGLDRHHKQCTGQTDKAGKTYFLLIWLLAAVCTTRKDLCHSSILLYKNVSATKMSLQQVCPSFLEMVKECVVAAMAAGVGVNSIKHLENLLPNRQPISAGRAEYVLETKHLMRQERSSKKF